MIKIEQQYLIMDYTKELKEALGKLRKFVNKKRLSTYKNCIYFKRECNGDILLYATDNRALCIYRIKNEGYTFLEKTLRLEWSTRQINEDENTIKFLIIDTDVVHIDPFVKNVDNPYGVIITDTYDFLDFCAIHLKGESKSVQDNSVIRFFQKRNKIVFECGLKDNCGNYCLDSPAVYDMAECDQPSQDFIKDRNILIRTKELKTVLSCLICEDFLFDFNSYASAVRIKDEDFCYWIATRN